MGEITPSTDKSAEGWQSIVASWLDRIFPVKFFAKKIIDFLSRVALLPQKQQEESIKNMASYIDSVDKVIKQMRESGAPQEEIQNLINQTSVQLVKQNVSAMIILQAANEQGASNARQSSSVEILSTETVLDSSDGQPPQLGDKV